MICFFVFVGCCKFLFSDDLILDVFICCLYSGAMASQWVVSDSNMT